MHKGCGHCQKGGPIHGARKHRGNGKSRGPARMKDKKFTGKTLHRTTPGTAWAMVRDGKRPRGYSLAEIEEIRKRQILAAARREAFEKRPVTYRESEWYRRYW